jgi:hypothetical protein
VPFGKEQVIEELVLKPNSRAFKDYELPMREDGTVLFQPYALAVVGLKMAGHIAGAAQIVDRLCVADMMAVSHAVMGFFGPGLTTGSTP